MSTGATAGTTRGTGAPEDPHALRGGDLDLVIGEAVVLELAPASFASRALALLLDALVTLVLLIGLSVLLTGTSFLLDPAAIQALGVTVLVLVLVVVPGVVETLTRGRSLGKLALGLRIVRDDGGPIRARHAFIRAVAAFGETWMTIGSVALIASLANTKGKRVGDMLAGTYAVNERTAKVAVAPIVMPSELAGWAASADIGRLPDRLAMAVRQFLGRAERLHLGSRARLGSALAAEVATMVAPAAPAGTHPERFLAAVIAERRRRELDRLTREQEAARRREAVLHRLPHGLG